jgi:hypothetical protein
VRPVAQIAARRGQLVERARHERETIAAALAPLARADRAVSRVWPLAVAGFAALLVARPRGALRWVRYAFAARQVLNLFLFKKAPRT